MWFESPAVHLVQDPFSKTVVGVVIKRDGQEVFVRAKNGVVLACGSFEANAQMMQNFTQRTNSLPIGSLYNTGDGIVMGLEVARTCGTWTHSLVPGSNRSITMWNEPSSVQTLPASASPTRATAFTWAATARGSWTNRVATNTAT